MPKLIAEKILDSMKNFSSVEVVEAVYHLIDDYLTSIEKVEGASHFCKNTRCPSG